MRAVSSRGLRIGHGGIESGLDCPAQQRATLDQNACPTAQAPPALRPTDHLMATCRASAGPRDHCAQPRHNPNQLSTVSAARVKKPDETRQVAQSGRAGLEQENSWKPCHQSLALRADYWPAILLRATMCPPRQTPARTDRFALGRVQPGVKLARRAEGGQPQCSRLPVPVAIAPARHIGDLRRFNLQRCGACVANALLPLAKTGIKNRRKRTAAQRMLMSAVA